MQNISGYMLRIHQTAPISFYHEVYVYKAKSLKHKISMTSYSHTTRRGVLEIIDFKIRPL